MSKKIQIPSGLSDAANSIGFFLKQLFSPAPDPSMNSAIMVMSWISKALLVLGALTSFTSTIPSVYGLASGLLPLLYAQGITLVAVILIFMLTDLSFGALTPFVLNFTFSGRIAESFIFAIGGVLSWALIITLGGFSMYLSWSGASIPVHTSFKSPEMKDTQSLQDEKQKKITQEQERYRGLIASYVQADEKALKELKDNQHRNILDIQTYAQKRYGEHSHLVAEATSKAKADSTRRVDDFLKEHSKAPRQQREMDVAINSIRQHYDHLISETIQQNESIKKRHEEKISVSLIILRNFGAFSTAGFFVISIIIAIFTSKPETEKKP